MLLCLKLPKNCTSVYEKCKNAVTSGCPNSLNFSQTSVNKLLLKVRVITKKKNFSCRNYKKLANLSGKIWLKSIKHFRIKTSNDTILITNIIIMQ